MDSFILQDERTSHATAVPDLFLEYYMPSANGEFVKVYLYLLRAAGCREVNASLSAIADCFFCTETDVIRALKYWEKTGILALSQDTAGTVTSIRLLPLPVPAAYQASAGRVSAASPSPTAQDLTDRSAAVSNKAPVEVKEISPERALELKQREDVKQLLFIAHQYMKRLMTQQEIHRLLYFYDELHFSTELLEYLIEYCVSKGHESIRYLEKVALSWYEAGITTVEMAKQETNLYNQKFFPIMKAFGIRGRNPIPVEVEAMKRWLSDYGFSLEIISEACARTVAATGQPNFSYAEAILSRWHSQNVRTLKDIQALDAQKKNKPAQTARTAAPNRFNNFEQRNYDFDRLADQLLDTK